jgi:hypothetical protein
VASFIPGASVPGERGVPAGTGAGGAGSASAGAGGAEGGSAGGAEPPQPGAQSMGAGTVLGSTAARSADMRASRMEAGLEGVSAAPGGAQSTQQGTRRVAGAGRGSGRGGPARGGCYDCAWLSLTALSTVTCNLWL